MNHHSYGRNLLIIQILITKAQRACLDATGIRRIKEGSLKTPRPAATTA